MPSNTRLTSFQQEAPTAPRSSYALRKRANEITAFGPLVRTLDAVVAELNEIENAQHLLKRLLTDDSIDVEAAIRVARRIRFLNLAVRWKLCRRILEEPECFERLVNAADPLKKSTSSAPG